MLLKIISEHKKSDYHKEGQIENFKLVYYAKRIINYDYYGID